MDLKLLQVFDEVYKTRNVSRAGENLGMRQSSVSIALARLRRHFGDPLFVRTSDGMQPTPHATALVDQVRQAIELLRIVTRQQAVFDAEKAARTFRICMTDITHIALLPALMTRVSEVAPNIQIEITHISNETARMLESGDADLAVGYMPALEAGFYQQKLFDQNFACVVQREHPRVRSRLTQMAFRRERHALVPTAGTGHELVERELERLGVHRKVVLRLPNFLGIGGLVASTDMMITVPQRVADTLLRIADVKVFPPPFEFPSFAIKQHWHERYQQDPANRWLRSVISDLFLEN
ncbi:LysR family transcriptional regulator [Rhizobacter sp. Root1221]|uniref:LysR family transcriptional regulator n=1 Tax=Rhizobacter sp. Root1221 TaxID=1736433 RepID=UPI00070094B6|nr:LysR family transcriptional regulator [Rhizobacter sp. Root1221]KQW01329.1 LysR family transcriptional regulator [Rhizobacter sp. Root1221]